MTPTTIAPAALAASVLAGALDLDAATAAWEAANPPPAWWPFPPDGRLDAYFPQVGNLAGHSNHGLPRSEALVEVIRTNEPHGRGRRPIVSWPDIIANTYPGDRIADVARRLGMERGQLHARRRLNPERAQSMDQRRGAV